MKLVLAAAMLLVVLPLIVPQGALAQTRPPQRPATQPATPPPVPPAEARRQFCESTMTELDTLVASGNAAIRGLRAAQRDVTRLAGQPGAEDARQRAENWRRMLDETMTELQKWTSVRAGLGCPVPVQ
jgi:hypothetical protein